MTLLMNIPKDKNYPTDSVQCDNCGGNGCVICENRGWLTPATHARGRRCMRDECQQPLPPNHIQVYCSNSCAFADA